MAIIFYKECVFKFLYILDNTPHQHQQHQNHDHNGHDHHHNHNRPPIPVQILISSFVAALRNRHGHPPTPNNGNSQNNTNPFNLGDFGGHVHIERTDAPGNNDSESLYRRLEELRNGSNPNSVPQPFTITISIPIPGSMNTEKKPDKQRAEILINALPKLHKGVVRRMNSVGIETTCGVCLDSLNCRSQLPESNENDESDKVGEGSSSNVNKESEDDIKQQEEIVALPCSHVFHSNCLRPWFALHTLCPSCRFDLDPNSDTLSKPDESESNNNNVNNNNDSVDDANNRDRERDNNQGSRSESILNRILRSRRHHPYSRPNSSSNSNLSTPSSSSNNNSNDNNSSNNNKRQQYKLPKGPRSFEEILLKREREYGFRCDLSNCEYAPKNDEMENNHSFKIKNMLNLKNLNDDKPLCQHFLHSYCYNKCNNQGKGNRYFNLSDNNDNGNDNDNDNEIESKCPICKSIGKLNKSLVI